MTEAHQSALGAGLLGIIILACLIWYMAVTPVPDFLKVPVPAPASPEPVVIKENTQYYEIDALYPSVTPLGATVGAEANQAAIAVMKGFIDESMATFKQNGNFAALTAEDLQMQGYNNGRTQALGIEYQEFASPVATSYLFSIYEDTMGAHPNSYYRTFVFDLRTGKQIQLKDLFAPGADYLTPLSNTARAGLSAQLGEDVNTEYLNSGTAPEDINFQNFVIDGDTLVILFPPYQVGPYALGPQKVSILLSRLGGIVADEYKP